MQSSNREDYLRAMYHLEEKKNEIKSIDIAHYLNISKPSVSEMLKTLNKDGFIDYKRYSKITLTAKGKEKAQNLTARHRIIESFLKNVLKVHHERVHEEAHKLEHAFSDESIYRLNRLLGNPKIDPHGKPIPRLGGRS